MLNSPSVTRAPIQKLDPVTIAKIAAGEVIDRPASIVKELIENAIDANATSILVEIERGGKHSIRVTDNGHGISKEDISLAPIRHTTSKITSLEEVYLTHTFGFRGEALGSICHVARCEILSNAEGHFGYRVIAYQGAISAPEPVPHTIGTTIWVKELFSDMPVRKKFLKSDATEMSHILEGVFQFAFIHSSIDFIVRSDGKEVFNSTGNPESLDRIRLVYGKELTKDLLRLDVSIENRIYSGFISNPTRTFPNRSKQIMAVNQRVIKSPLLQRAVSEAYKDYVPPSRYPFILLNVAIPTQTVDINIHPQKQDIRFRDTSSVFRTTKQAIETGLVSFKIQENSPAFFSNVSQQTPSSLVSETPPVTMDYTNNPLFSPLFDASVHTQSQFYDYLQLFDTYLVIKTETQLWIMDQHAVHERILYEKLKNYWNTSVHLRQPLLISEIIPLTPELEAIWKESASVFTALNMVIEEFGDHHIIVREVPAVFSELNLRQFILDLLYETRAVTADPTLLDSRKETLQMKACKAAIKAGKKMAPEEVRQLIEEFIASPNAFTCPHGRPLVLRWNQEDLEKLFKRR